MRTHVSSTPSGRLSKLSLRSRALLAISPLALFRAEAQYATHRKLSITGLTFAAVLALSHTTNAQNTIFSENLGTPAGTTSITSYATGTAPATFQNSGLLTFGSGDQPASTAAADLRATTTSITYLGASGGGNVFFTSSAGARGFSVEGINAAGFTGLQLAYGYRKESATAHATLSVDYWNGGSWV